MVKRRSHTKSISRPRFAVVVSLFNSSITEKLLQACLDEFRRHDVRARDVQVVKVPGAFEIPVVALKLARKKDIAAVICLGAIIKGQTLHYELVASETARGVQDVALMTGKPVIFEVLVADTVALCQDRARDGDHDNKGASAARAAVEIVATLSKL